MHINSCLGYYNFKKGYDWTEMSKMAFKGYDNEKQDCIQ